MPASVREHCLSAGHDVFVLILRAFVDDIDEWSVDVIRRTTIRLVSSAWKSTLDDNQALWSRIFLSPHMHRHYIERTFYNARDVPKTIILHLGRVWHIPSTSNLYPDYRTVEPDPLYVRSVALALASHATTIRGLAVAVNAADDWNDLVRLLDAIEFPALQSFGVAADTMQHRFSQSL